MSRTRAFLSHSPMLTRRRAPVDSPSRSCYADVMGRMLEIESSPRWLRITHGVSFVAWCGIVLAGSGRLAHILKTHPDHLFMLISGFHFGPFTTYLSFFVCLAFTSRIALALRKSESGPLRIVSISASTRLLGLAAIASTIYLARQLQFAWDWRHPGGLDRGTDVGNVENILYCSFAIIGVLSIWIFFLTVKFALGMVSRPSTA